MQTTIAFFLLLTFLLLPSTTSFQILSPPQNNPQKYTTPDHSTCTTQINSMLMVLIEQSGIFYGDNVKKNVQYILQSLNSDGQWNVVIFTNARSVSQFYTLMWETQCEFVSTGQNRYNPTFTYVITKNKPIDGKYVDVSFQVDGYGDMSQTKYYKISDIIQSVSQQIPGLYEHQAKFIESKLYEMQQQTHWAVIIAEKQLTSNAIGRVKSSTYKRVAEFTQYSYNVKYYILMM